MKAEPPMSDPVALCVRFNVPIGALYEWSWYIILIHVRRIYVRNAKRNLSRIYPLVVVKRGP